MRRFARSVWPVKAERGVWKDRHKPAKFAVLNPVKGAVTVQLAQGVPAAELRHAMNHDSVLMAEPGVGERRAGGVTVGQREASVPGETSERCVRARLILFETRGRRTCSPALEIGIARAVKAARVGLEAHREVMSWQWLRGAGDSARAAWHTNGPERAPGATVAPSPPMVFRRIWPLPLRLKPSHSMAPAPRLLATIKGETLLSLADRLPETAQDAKTRPSTLICSASAKCAAS